MLVSCGFKHGLACVAGGIVKFEQQNSKNEWWSCEGMPLSVAAYAARDSSAAKTSPSCMGNTASYGG